MQIFLKSITTRQVTLLEHLTLFNKHHQQYHCYSLFTGAFGICVLLHSDVHSRKYTQYLAHAFTCNDRIVYWIFSLP